MAVRRTFVWLMAGCLCAAACRAGENLCVNGTFDDAENPLKGWNVDYRWTGNQNYLDNDTRVSAVASDGAKRQVLRIDGSKETKAESTPIPFDPEARYRCTLQMRGGPVRIYFSGYKWKSGVRPYENPPLSELQQIYKSKTDTHESRAWQSVTLEFPLKNLSERGLQELKKVRFVTLYMIAFGETFVDNVEVKRVN